MNNFTENYKKIIIPIIEKHIPQAKIILYGSRARGDFKEGSDIDIALDADCRIDDLLMSKIMGEIEESDLPIHFDLVDFQAVAHKVQQEINKDGVLWKK